MITFHKDQFGVHVYYAGMNASISPNDGLTLNMKMDFDPSETQVVPHVKRITSVETKTQTVGFKHTESSKTMTEAAYRAELQLLQNATLNPIDVEQEVANEVALRRFKEEWEEETKEVINHIDHEFEVVDIEYPADERLVPMRGFDEKRINYFKVDGKAVAIAMMHKLCRAGGLKEREDRYGADAARMYHIEDSYSLRWRIEGKSFEDCLEGVNLKTFSGHLSECREHINMVEGAVRKGFDLWTISGRTARGITVAYVTDALATLERMVRNVDSKIKTRNYHESALQHIEKIKNEVMAMGVEELMEEEENLSDALDNATL